MWDGLPGLPGLSVHYAATADAVAAVAALTTFFNAIKGNHPTGLSWQLPSSGDTIDSGTGALTGGWTGATGSTIAANGGPGVYAAGAGMRVTWPTAGIGAHKRIVGSTFLVPLLGSLYDTNGTIAAGTVTTTQTAANAVVASAKVQIWHRPSPGGSDGALWPMLSATVPDKVATLRSRRT